MDPSKYDQPIVAVDGRVASFGECLRNALFDEKVEGDGPYKIVAQFSYPFLNLCESKDKESGVSFQHAPHCPAMVFNSPDSARTIRVGVATVLERDGMVLLTRRHASLRSFPNLWVLPGGHIEASETLEETATRELYEEVGLSKGIKMDGILGIWESTYPHRATIGPITHHHAVCYMHAIGNEVEDALVQVSEVQAIAWLTAEQVRDVVNGSEESSVQVLEAEESSATQTATTDDSWNKNRAHVKLGNEKRNSRWVYDNMTAGTRFALWLWLEKKSKVGKL